MDRGAIRFTNSKYAELDMSNENIKLTTEIDGVIKEYDVTGGSSITGSFKLEMKDFPKTMTAGDTFQIPVTYPQGTVMSYVSSASQSKISINDNGLMTCIGNSTGWCGIDIICTRESDDTIFAKIHTRVEVV